MDKGTIFFHKKFEFRDGEIGRKLLILLNIPDIKKNIPALDCRTTSNPKNKPCKRGCYDTKNLFMIPAKHDFFDLDTWVRIPVGSITHSGVSITHSGDCDHLIGAKRRCPF